jgi:hypothetical protein
LLRNKDITETGQSNFLRSLSVVLLGFNRDRDIPIPEVIEELSSPKSSFFTPEESFDQWDLPRSSKLGVVDDTLTPWNEGNENRLEFRTLSSASASAFGYSRSFSNMDVTSSLLPPIIPSLISSPTLMSTCSSSSSSSGAHSVIVVSAKHSSVHINK